MESETGKEFGRFLLNIAALTYVSAIIGSEAVIGFKLACVLGAGFAVLGILFIKFSSKKKRW